MEYWRNWWHWYLRDGFQHSLIYFLTKNIYVIFSVTIGSNLTHNYDPWFGMMYSRAVQTSAQSHFLAQLIISSLFGKIINHQLWLQQFHVPMIGYLFGISSIFILHLCTLLPSILNYWFKSWPWCSVNRLWRTQVWFLTGPGWKSSLLSFSSCLLDIINRLDQQRAASIYSPLLSTV